MGSLSVSYAPGGNVSTGNPNDVVYIKGDDSTDGSIRLIPDISNSTEMEVQLRSNGVWNDTGIVIAASTVYLGRELQISGGGEYMLTKDQNTDIRSLIPHVRFDSVNGTDEIVVVPRVGAIATDQIIQSDDSGEVSGSTIQFVGGSTALILANALLLRTGAAATGDVTLQLHRDSYTEGLFYSRTYPQATFTADSDITLATDGLVEFTANEVFYVTLTCTGTLTLKADVTNTTPYYGANFYTLEEDTITPDEFGGATKYLTFDNDGHAVCDNAGLAVLGYGNGTELTPPVASIGSAFSGALSFDATTSTELLATIPKSLYRFTGTGGATLTLSDNTKDFADTTHAWLFTIKDEGGDCTANPLTITPESGTIDGAASIQIVIDYGSVLIYSNGQDFWSI